MKLIRHVIHRPDIVGTPSKMGVGTFIQKQIKKAVEASPLSAEHKRKILECKGCEQRAEFLDKTLPSIPVRSKTK